MRKIHIRLLFGFRIIELEPFWKKENISISINNFTSAEPDFPHTDSDEVSRRRNSSGESCPYSIILSLPWFLYVVMYDIALLFSGLSIMLSIFLLVITLRVAMRRRVKILSYIIGVFFVILISNILFVLQIFSFFPYSINQVTLLLAAELAILLLFYAGIVRGIG